jgi:hypothetical protein
MNDVCSLRVCQLRNSADSSSTDDKYVPSVLQSLLRLVDLFFAFCNLISIFGQIEPFLLCVLALSGFPVVLNVHEYGGSATPRSTTHLHVKAYLNNLQRGGNKGLRVPGFGSR